VGEGKTLADAAHNERGNNGQRERNAHAQRSALAHPRVDLDFAADLFHVGADHVHAHAAPAYVGYLGGRGKSGQEDHLQQIALAELRGAIRRQQAALDGLVADLLGRDAGAVVGDLDHHVAAFLRGPQSERALGVLARGLAHRRRLNAVIERIAHRVGERILDGFKQALVELRLLAFHDQARAAAQRVRQIAD
jgi:hypothetical protein